MIARVTRLSGPVWLYLGLLLIPTAHGSAQGIDPNQPDTLWVDSVTAFTTAFEAVVPVSFFNDEELSGVEVLLEYGPNPVVLDSFSFLGGRLENADFNGTSFTADSSVITIFAYDDIPVGSGLLGNLYFSWDMSVEPHLVTIDTTSITNGQIIRSTTFSDAGFITFVPQFDPGFIDLQYEPPEPDSIWLHDADGMANEPLAIDVMFFNDKPVVDFILALDYASYWLDYDSISFQGSRPMPLPTNSPLVQNQISTHELLLRLSFDEAEPLEAGSGLLAQLWFTVDADAEDTSLVIDTTLFAGVIGTLVKRPLAIGGKSFIPFFSGSNVSIQTSTDVKDITEDTELPTSFELSQNYPNPFNPTTQIRFSLPEAGYVKLDVFNVLGQQVRRLIDQPLPAGTHEVTFDGQSDGGHSLASGLYFYRLVHDHYSECRKMILLK